MFGNLEDDEGVDADRLEGTGYTAGKISLMDQKYRLAAAGLTKP